MPLKPTVDQSSHLRRWLPFAAMITICLAATCLALITYIRSSTDQQSIYITEGVASDLFHNKSPSAAVSSSDVDIASSAAPFVVLYDSNGRAADGTGRINGQLPSLPSGIYDKARGQEDVRFTWEPQKNIQVAAVVRYYQSDKRAGFVLAGKNLRETERQQITTVTIFAIAWVATLISTLALTHPRFLDIRK